MARSFCREIWAKSIKRWNVSCRASKSYLIEAMKEKGIDISRSAPRMVTPEMINGANLVVTIGCYLGEVCPKPVLAQMQKS